MSNFIFWYKKEVKAESASEAFKNSRKEKLKFHSVEKKKDEEYNNFDSAIGFQYYPEPDDF